MFLSFFFQQSARTSPLETWIFTKAVSPMGVCPSQRSPGAPRPQLKGDEVGSRGAASSKARAMVCLPIT